MNSSYQCSRNIVLPPMPKIEDFGIESWSGANSTGSTGVIFKTQLKVYNEALTAWERVCMAIAGTINRAD